MPLAVDHVLFAALDLTTAAREVESRYGLASIEGGCHPGWGTADRIIPLGETYLELVTVVDTDTAAASTFGRWVAAGKTGRPLRCAVRSDSIDAVGKRLGLKPTPGVRTTPSGQVVEWRSVGVAEAAAEPSLPFFIEWGDGSPFPGREAMDRAGSTTLGHVSLTGDARRLARWLGDHDLPITIRIGPSAVDRVLLVQGDREIQFEF
jgi:hypothetical protein